MGDRVLITFKTTDKATKTTDYSPTIYMHWAGEGAKQMLLNAAPALRRGDIGYSAARFCGECHKSLVGVTGLGLFAAPDPTKPDFDWNEFSHGDAGVYVVDVQTGKVTAHGGYGTGFQIPVAEMGT